MSKNGDSSAYPTIERCGRCAGRGVTNSYTGTVCTVCNGAGRLHEGGMTKHERFVMAAMRGLLADGKGRTCAASFLTGTDIEVAVKLCGVVAESSVMMADAVLAELAKGQP